MTREVHVGWRTWLEGALGFFYPAACQLCGVHRARPDEGLVCAACRGRAGAVRFVEPPFCERCGLPYDGEINGPFACGNCRDLQLHFSRARAAVIASDLVLEVIHRYKYGRALWFEPFLAGLLVRQAALALRREAWDGIVPVPLFPVKEREREFNQAERLARRLGAATGLPVETRRVRRVRSTRTQTLLTRPQRADNMRGAFAAGADASLKGKRLVLVDDVLTTGATTSACAQALLEAGAGEVCVWTLARGL